MVDKKAVLNAGKIKAIGPYSLAVQAGNLTFVSGQLGINPETDVFAGTDVTTQADQAFKNLAVVLGELGLSLKDVMKVDVFLKNMQDFPKLNDVYKRVFDAALGGGAYPARTTVEVASLPKGGLVEIAVICVK